MAWGARKHERIVFDKKLAAHLVGPNKSWHRECVVADISAGGAKLILGDPAKALEAREFHLLLSPGSVTRKCEVVRISGAEVGVRFLKAKAHGKSGGGVRP